MRCCNVRARHTSWAASIRQPHQVSIYHIRGRIWTRCCTSSLNMDCMNRRLSSRANSARTGGLFLVTRARLLLPPPPPLPRCRGASARYRSRRSRWRSVDIALRARSTCAEAYNLYIVVSRICPRSRKCFDSQRRCRRYGPCRRHTCGILSATPFDAHARGGRFSWTIHRHRQTCAIKCIPLCYTARMRSHASSVAMRRNAEACMRGLSGCCASRAATLRPLLCRGCSSISSSSALTTGTGIHALQLARVECSDC